MRTQIIFIVFFIIFRSTAFSQDITNVIKLNSLAEVLAKAVQNNPKQGVYLQRIKQASYNYKAAKGFLLPSASGTFNGTDNLSLGVTPVPGELIGQPGTTYYAQFGRKFNYNAGINLGQTIFDWQTILEIAIAKKNIELNQQDQNSFQQKLKEQVANVYLTTLVAKSSLAIANRDQALADSLVTVVKQRFQEGTEDMIAVNASLVNFNNIQQNKAKSQQLYDQGKENLKVLLGEHPENEIEFEEELKLDVTAETAVNLGKDYSLDIYSTQLELADLRSKSQRSVAYPKLSASAYFGAQQFRNDFGLSLNSNAWSRYQYIGINLSVPIFTGFTNTNKYKSAAAQKEIAALQYSNAKQESQINDRLLVKNYASYQTMLSASEKNFKLYNSTLQLNKQKYNEGLLRMDIYLKAFLDYLNAENVYLNDLSQLFIIKSTLISRQ